MLSTSCTLTPGTFAPMCNNANFLLDQGEKLGPVCVFTNYSGLGELITDLADRY